MVSQVEVRVNFLFKRIQGVSVVLENVGLNVTMDPDGACLVELLVRDASFTNDRLISEGTHVLSLRIEDHSQITLA